MTKKPLRFLTALCIVLSTAAHAQIWNVSTGPSGIPLHTNVSGVQQEAVLCATTVRDGIIYAWKDNRTGTNNQDIWVQKMTPCGDVAPGWPVAGLSICNATNNQEVPQIIPDGSDGAIIVWVDRRSGNADIYAQHVNGAGVPTWGSATTGMSVCTMAGTTQDNPHLCTDGAGGAIIVWDDNRSGNDDVWANRVNAAGTLLWNGNTGNPVVIQSNAQHFNTICSDGAGGAYLAWEDNRPSANGTDIFATRLDANGNPVAPWTAGVCLSNINGGQNTPCCALYPNGDVVFAWCDPFGTGQSVQASKFLASGSYAAGWNINGNLVGYAITSSGNPGTATNPRIVVDCSGGCYISYRSPYGGGDNDVITRRMNSNGTQGVQELTAFGTNWEGNHELAADGNGGAYNTFEDRNAPIYIKYRKFGSGTVTASSGTGDRHIPNICAMQGVAYLVWQDQRPGTGGTSDLYVGATSALAPPPILNSTLTQTYTATSCNIATQNVTTCSGSSITFTVPLPGGLFNTYTFLDGATTLQSSSSNTFTTSSLSVGTHTITATSSTAGGCTTAASNQIIVTISAGPTLTLSSQSNVSCNGGTNGAATMTASAGTAPYTYAWSPSGGTAATATGLSAGTYSCVVTDATGCTRTQTVSITQPNAITDTATTTPATCGSNNGSATVNPSGGVGGYTYLWSPSGGTAATATGLTAGSYTCTITDANGCTLVEPVNVNSAGGPTISLSTQTNVTCNGGSDGAATMTVSGGTSPFSYVWSSLPNTTPSVTGIPAGSYTCTVTDANNCVQSATVLITEPPVLTVSMSSSDVLCNGGNSGTAYVTAGGGVGSFTYQWSPAGGTADTANGLSAISYTCVITDGNGCTISESVTITEPTALVTSNSQTNVSCNGGNNGTGTVSASGGTGSFTYAWSSGGTSATEIMLSATTYTCVITDGNGCSATETITITQPTVISGTFTAVDASCGNNNGTATVTASGGTSPYSYFWPSSGTNNATDTNMAPGTFTCIFSDNNGCTDSVSVTIQNAGTPAVTIATQTDITCFGMNDGQVSVNVTGGSGPYTYSWSPSGGTSNAATGLGPATYTCTVTDASGCTQTQTATIIEPSALSVTISGTDDTCAAGNGTASVAVTGGTGSYTYGWSPSGGTAATASGLTANVYTCTISDANGCTTTSTVSIQNTGGATVALSSQTNVMCNGDLSGSAMMSATGGNSPYTYSWSPSGGTSATASGLGAGTYTCTVTDATGCTSAQTVAITQPLSALTVTDASSNGCGTNSAIGSVTAIGGTSPYTYAWSSGGSGATESNLATGTYSCIVSDANGCADTISVSVIANPNPTATVTASQTVPMGGSATISAGGGTNYAWTPTTDLSCTNCATPLADPAQTTMYCVTVTDLNNCNDSACTFIYVNSDCGEIFVPNAFSPNNDNSNDELCIYGNQCIKEMTFVIYDRWGEKVYESDNPAACWNGTYKDKALNTGVYVYYLHGTTYNGDVLDKQGNISLMR